MSALAVKDQLIHDMVNVLKQFIPSGNDTDLSKTVTLPSEKYEYVNLGGLVYNDPFHRCTFCHYGFKIAGKDGNQYYAITMSKVSTYESITCPKCGNVDRIY